MRAAVFLRVRCAGDDVFLIYAFFFVDAQEVPHCRSLQSRSRNYLATDSQHKRWNTSLSRENVSQTPTAEKGMGKVKAVSIFAQSAAKLKSVESIAGSSKHSHKYKSPLQAKAEAKKKKAVVLRSKKYKAFTVAEAKQGEKDRHKQEKAKAWHKKHEHDKGTDKHASTFPSLSIGPPSTTS